MTLHAIPMNDSTSANLNHAESGLVGGGIETGIKNSIQRREYLSVEAGAWAVVAAPLTGRIISQRIYDQRGDMVVARFLFHIVMLKRSRATLATSTL